MAILCLWSISLRRWAPRVEVISFTYNTARDLINSADEHIPIEEALLLRNSTQAESAT